MTKVELANTALARHSFVRGITISFDYLKTAYNITLLLSTTEDDYSSEIELTFHDVSGLNLKDFGGGLCQLLQLMIIKIDRGLDRIRYEVVDIERELISFSFFSFEVIDGYKPEHNT